MTNIAGYDVFNGDADGICALIQLRMVEPRDSYLITGVKRNIELLKNVQAGVGDRVTVLDVSMDKNHRHLQRILSNGADVFYIDHHYAGTIPESTSLTPLINESADVCTSLLVNQYLHGAYPGWAVVGAFGDNLKKSARGLAKSLDISSYQLSLLEKLGTYINYNSYGTHIGELLFHPAKLYQLIAHYEDPLDFITDSQEEYEKLETLYNNDLQLAKTAEAIMIKAHIAIYRLPDEAWARRVGGVFSNYLANNNPDRAHAVLTSKPNGNFLVSVRAPLNNKHGASALCRQFPTGGGRETAAGINDLALELLNDFVSKFERTYEYSAVMKQDTLIMEYNPTIEELND